MSFAKSALLSALLASTVVGQSSSARGGRRGARHGKYHGTSTTRASQQPTTDSIVTLTSTTTISVTDDGAAVTPSTAAMPTTATSSASLPSQSATDILPVQTSTMATVVVPSSSLPTPASTSSQATSSASAASTYAAVATSTAGKKGLAYNDASLTNAWTGSNVAFAYNWGSTAGQIAASIPYVPLAWCTNQDLNTWTSNAQTAINGGSTHMLGFNEPDQGPENPQCNIPVASAVSGHKQYMNPFKGRVKIGSPAVTNGGPTRSDGAPMGLAYLTAFLQGCANDCAIDFLAIHWYSPIASDVDAGVSYFQSHVNAAIALGQQQDPAINEVWITEFAPTDGTDAQKAQFVTAVTSWMDGNANVGGYAYQMLEAGSLASSDGSVSPVIGKAYAAAA